MLLWGCSSLRRVGRSQRVAIDFRQKASGGVMEMDYILGGVTALLLFIYLIYALLKPEKF